MKRIPPALLCSFLLLITGCFTFDVEPVYELEDDELVVVYPFKDRDFRSPWDSITGLELAIHTTAVLQRMAEFQVVSFDDVQELMVAPPAKERQDADDSAVGLDVKKLTPKKLADAVGADYVLVCDIDMFQLKDPLNINMTRATGKATVRLFKVAISDQELEEAEAENERQRRILQARKELGLGPSKRFGEGGRYVTENRVTAKFPDTYLQQYGVAFMDTGEAREGLIRNLAKEVAKLYYPHEPED